MGLIVIRYGEIGLKGKNRWYFVRRLRKNIRDYLKKNDLTGEVRSVGQRVYVHVEDMERAVDKLRDVFSVVSLSPSQEIAADIEAITAEALRAAQSAGLDEGRTHRMQSRRANKTFPLTSPEINRLVGAQVHEATGAQADLSNEADLTIGVEVRRGHAPVYGQTVAGHGRLPLRTEGRQRSFES
jgi:thiamine biosynthesis protein ThiI